MDSKVGRWATKVGLIIWFIYIISLYLVHRSYYLLSISEAYYSNTIITIGAIIAIVTAILHYTKLRFSGLLGYLLLLVFIVLIYGAYVDRPYYSELTGGKYGRMLMTILGLHLQLLLLALSSYCAGFLIPIPQINVFKRYGAGLIRMAMGVMLLTLGAFLLAFPSLLNTYTAWALVLLPIGIRYRDALSFLKGIVRVDIVSDENKSVVIHVLAQITIVALAMYLLGAYKMFPIGFDSTAVYQNVSNLILDSHGFVSGYHPYNWSLFTALGAQLLGDMSLSLYLSHSMVIPLLLISFHISRSLMPLKYAWLLVCMIALLPGIGFLSFVDSKVDLAYAFFALVTIYYLLKAYDISLSSKKLLQVVILIGCLLGYLMGVKFLAIMLLAGVVGYIFYVHFGIWSSLLSFLGFTSLFFIMRVDKFGQTDIAGWERMILIILPLAIALFLLFRLNLIKAAPDGFWKRIIVLGLVFNLSFAPWIIKHASEGGLSNPISLVFGNTESARSKYKLDWLESNNIPLQLPSEISGLMTSHLNELSTYQFVSDNQLVADWLEQAKLSWFKELKSLTKYGRTGRREEVQRFLGYEQGAVKYISAPIDVTLGSNVVNRRGTDYGLLLLLFGPLVLLFARGKSKLARLSQLALLGVIMLFSYAGSFENMRAASIEAYLSKISGESNDMLDYLKESVYTPFVELQYLIVSGLKPLYDLIGKSNYLISLILFTLVMAAWFIGGRKLWRTIPRFGKGLLIISLIYGFYWIILGNVIPYYALPIWCILLMVLFHWAAHMDRYVVDAWSGMLRYLFKGVSVLVLLLSFMQLFTNQSNNWSDGDNLYYPPFLYHLSHSEGIEHTYEKKLPTLSNSLDRINEDLDAKVYRVGTFLNYHIKNNNTRVLEDNQLGLYQTVSNVLKDETGFCDFLKAEGYRYVVLDLNVASIDNTPNKRLTQKATNFVKMLNDCNVELIYTNRVVERKDAQGNMVRGNALKGKVVSKGDTAIFYIK